MKTSNIAGIICSIAEHDDQRAFRELFDLYSPGLLSYTVAVVKSRALAEEIVADVFVNLWKNRKNLIAIKNLTYYLYTANKNILLNHISKEKKFVSISLGNIEYSGAYEYLNPEEICIGKANINSKLTINDPFAGFRPVGGASRLLIVMSWLLLLVACGEKEKIPPPKPQQPPTGVATFKNPLLASAPDPWVVQRGDFYYYMHTLGNRIQIWKTAKMSQLGSALTYTVFNAPSTGINSRDVWAPEMFFLDNKWYIYYTASDGQDVNHRMFVLENANADPTTLNWVDKGQLQTDPSDLWSIDGTILEHGGQLYFIWSGRPGAKTGNLTQNLYISKMQNPYTLTGATVMISTPTYAWERYGFSVNEGPEILKNKDGKVFLIYSGSYCGNDNYSLGMLTLTGADPLSPANWTKTATPVFSNSSVTGAYATGHNGFFKSKDGTEDWIIYHANSSANQGCGGNRNVRMQKFTWTSTGEPNFGIPVEIGKAIPVPKGE